MVTAYIARCVVIACRNGASVLEAANHYNISESSVTRIIRAARARGEEIGIRMGRPKISRRKFEFRARDLVNDSDVDDVCAMLHGTEFPFPEPLSAEKMSGCVKRLSDLEMWLENETIRPWTPIGVKVCAPFFPNRYKARWRSAPSAFEAWGDDEELRRAVRFQIQHGDPVTPLRVRRAVTLRCRTPMIFRPAVARFVYERYCPRGGTAWDPCAGYGGRLLGAATSGIRYIGCDVDQATVDGNRALASAIGYNADVHCVRAESFDPGPVDFVFTSPPYFDREKYSDGANQSSSMYGEFTDWVNGFLRPVIDTAFRSIVVGGNLVLNVSGTLLVGRTIQAATDAGFVKVEELKMPLAAVNRKNPTEPVLVFRKETPGH